MPLSSRNKLCCFFLKVFLLVCVFYVKKYVPAERYTNKLVKASHLPLTVTVQHACWIVENIDLKNYLSNYCLGKCLF